MTTDRIAPHNLDAERSVLGSCFLDDDAIDIIEMQFRDLELTLRVFKLY